MFNAALLVIFPCLVAFAAATDLFTMTIPNRVSILLLAGFFVLTPYVELSLATFGWHLAAGALVLGVCFCCFAFGWMGGGDAKLAATIAVWFGFTPQMLNFILLALIYGAVLTVLLLAFRQTPYLPALVRRQEWILRLHDKKTGVPYGIALAAAALQIYPETVWFSVLSG